MIYLGVDPGGSGAIALIRKQELLTCRFSETPSDVCEWLNENVSWADVTCACLMEKVHSMPKQGVSSTFKFGVSFGMYQGVLLAMGISFDFVQPTKWQQAFGLTRKDKNESTTAKKNRHKAVAQRLFPQAKVTLKDCDAILIAEYCRRLYER